MKAFSMGRKITSFALLIAGALMLVIALALDFSGSGTSFRGPLLVIGLIALLAGLYLFPTLKYHKNIINFLFLFPLLFTFGVTVIIPLVLGIFYSMTDWTGIGYTQFVGFANYMTMFKEVSFLWSLLLTILFVLVNMIMVNLVGFALALLCTSRLKGVGFFRASSWCTSGSMPVTLCSFTSTVWSRCPAM